MQPLQLFFDIYAVIHVPPLIDRCLQAFRLIKSSQKYYDHTCTRPALKLPIALRLPKNLIDLTIYKTDQRAHVTKGRANSVACPILDTAPVLNSLY